MAHIRAYTHLVHTGVHIPHLVHTGVHIYHRVPKEEERLSAQHASFSTRVVYLVYMPSYLPGWYTRFCSTSGRILP